MCKKNKAGGCNCCCKPILSRVDELDSRWPCWRDHVYNADGTAVPLSPRWEWSSGQLFRRDVSTDSLAEARRGIAADAVLLAAPFSMEWILEFDSIYFNGSSKIPFRLGVNNRYASSAVTSLYIEFNQSSGGGFIERSAAGTVDSRAITFSSSGSLKVQLRLQVDTDGVTSWVWFNDTAPTYGTVIGGSISQGVKRTGTMPSGTQTLSNWWLNMTASIRSYPDDMAVINRLEVWKWNHTMEVREEPVSMGGP